MKQVIVVRSDIVMSKGKLAAQACHGSVSAVLKSKDAIIKRWELEGQKKVILKAGSLEDLRSIKDRCTKAGIIHALISDAGHTELEPGTVTALGIGPDEDVRIDKITGSLPLLK